MVFLSEEEFSLSLVSPLDREPVRAWEGALHSPHMYISYMHAVYEHKIYDYNCA